MSFTCPQCRGVFSSGETCQDRFTLSQLTEAEQPAYYAVHHLSVLAYMLQHNGYSQRGWLEARQLLYRFVHQNLDPAQARRQNQGRVDSGHRTWSFTKGPKLPGVERIAWDYTLASVRLETAELYCADVRHWAERVLTNSAPLIHDREGSASASA